MIEIERKFLVKSDKYKSESTKNYRIVQGFLSTDPDRIVRIRIKGNQGFLTIKGKTNNAGLSRFEWEKEIDLQEAESLLNLCLPGVIDKIRYELIFKGKTFEIDEFYGENQGLTIAEVELNSETEIIELPDWIDLEVTGDQKYYNSNLIKNPYKKWK